MFCSQNELPCIFEQWQFPSRWKVKIVKKSKKHDYISNYNSVDCSIDLSLCLFFYENNLKANITFFNHLCVHCIAASHLIHCWYFLIIASDSNFLKFNAYVINTIISRSHGAVTRRHILWP